MKTLKRVLIIGIITLVSILTMSIDSKAATVRITTDVINMREEASTDSAVIARLSEDVECEYLGEEGDWYQVRYQRYTGYVSKQYSELVEDASETNDTTNQTDNSNTNTDNNEAVDNNNNQTNENTQQTTDTQTDNNTQTETSQLIYKEFNQNTIIRILPLIYSSNIGEAKNGDEVLILTETSGWSYIQTDEINGWVRTDTLGESKTVEPGDSNQNDENSTTTERVGYISEEDVNMRSGAGTSNSVIRVLDLNTEVTILGEEGNWYRIRTGNTTGYVSKDYVSDSRTVTSRSLSEPRTDQENEEEKTEKETTSVEEDNTSNSTETTNSDKKETTTNKTTTSETSDKPTSNSSSTTTTSDVVKGTDIVAYAKNFLGYKYVWGGDGSNETFDCSGFTMYVYEHFDVTLPHYTVSQYNSSKGTKITKQSDLKMGDIVFLTDYETGAACGHCGIYISDGDFIHADSSVGYVNISNLNGIYKGRFCGALRVF